MTDFGTLQSVLDEWPSQPPTEKFSDSVLERVRCLLQSANNDAATVGAGDLAGVIRHALRKRTLCDPQGTTILRVPRAAGWPDETHWKQSHVQVVSQDATHFRVAATEDWHIGWLHGSERHPPLKASFSETLRRDLWPSSPHLPLDPTLKFGLKLPFDSYSSPGQRQAVQAAFLMNPGATLVVNLPTGSGKSLVAWAPALAASSNSLTVMVTPTVALAIDQENQLRDNYPTAELENLPRQLAWHGGLDQQARSEIRQRLRNGTQRILITSPESLVGALAGPVYKAADEGRLAYFVVDEAHLVSQWGNEFRPEFQSMCGMHRELIARCPGEQRFRTLLLSATLTQASLSTLEELFSNGEFAHVCGVALRPEPEYWIAEAANATQRQEYVKELIRVVPRPFLLYVTKREDAEGWLEIIHSMQIRRCGMVHGASLAADRERVIDQWRAGGLDCVVATSAFGLGMDKRDVRTAIHACVPESVDRYYQEVGRSGRDGNASASFLVHCESDLDVARTISSERIITVEKGLPRWKSMIRTAQPSDGLHLVRLDSKTATVRQDTESNENWNLHTLVLLHRAGVIELCSSPPPEITKGDEESDTKSEERIEQKMTEYRMTVPIKLLTDAHDDETLWHTKIEETRGKMQQPGWDGLDGMRELLSCRVEIGESLCKAYSVISESKNFLPAHVCAGCPVCRERGSTSSIFSFPEPDLVACVDIEHERIRRVFGDSSGNLVFVSCPDKPDEIQLLLRRLAGMGIVEFALPESWMQSSNWKSVYKSAPNGFVIGRSLESEDDFENQLRVPRATCFLHGDERPIPEHISLLERPFHIVFADENTPDREFAHKKHFDVRPSIALRDFVRRIQS